MSFNKRIPVRDFLKDVRLGLADYHLMKKYSLSAHELTTAFRLLLEGEFLDAAEFEAWSIFGSSIESLDKIRLHRRQPIHFKLPIMRIDSPDIRGKVLNISKAGLAAEGIRARPGELLEVVISGHSLLEGRCIDLDVRCKWAHPHPMTGNLMAGFYVIFAAQGRWEDLRKLVTMFNSLKALEGELPEGAGNGQKLLQGATADV